ncbi:MAG TPA: ribonuclease HI family protein [Candidatus Aenigmarchaeota archaeon]|nr:ribonuclease HI family protein [Candidatus Aenigmarchaeota archaeon]
MYSRVYVYTDGGSRGNPGPAAIGVIVAEGGKILKEFGEYIGKATKNEAEYRAVIRGLETAGGFCRGEVVIVSDSELVVNQLRGLYRIRKSNLLRLFNLVRKREREFERVVYMHRRRQDPLLRRADMLVNLELNKRMSR